MPYGRRASGYCGMKSQTSAITESPSQREDLRLVQKVGAHTEILNIFIGQIANDTAGQPGARLLSGAQGLVDHYPIGPRRRDESEAVAECRHAAIVIHANPGERVPKNAEEKDGMAAQEECQLKFLE